MSRVDAPEGAVPHGRFVPSEWVAARRPEHIDSHGAPLVPGTGRKWHERFVVFPREVVTLPTLTAVPDLLAGRDGSPLYDGDRVIVVPCSKRYPIHNTTIDNFHGFVDDGENYRARAQRIYEGDDAAPPGLDDEQDWFDFELVALESPFWR